ncbi:MAG: glycosyltransferase family 1 protein [Thermoplasmatota archaeon]
MRVAIFTGTYVENKDGVSRSLYELVRILRQLKHTVGIWAPELTPQQDEGIRTFVLPSVPIPLYPDYKMTIYPKGLTKDLEEFNPDIIQISTPDPIALRFLKYAQIENIPIVSIYHTDFPSYLKYYNMDILEGRVWKEIVKFYNKCNVVFAPTNEMKKLLQSKGVKKVEIWSRGIRGDLFSPDKRSKELRRTWGAEGKKVIIYSGRFVKYKDLDTLIGVYDRIKRMRREDIRFVLLGSGPMEEELKERMKDAVFPGYLHGEELYNAYASGDIFLFPSSTETFGNVVQEAIASGLPSVVSNVGGCSEIVNESGAGIICMEKDVNDFTSAVLKLVDNASIRQKLIEKGTSWAEKRTWKYINMKMITFYEKLIEKRDPP